VPTSKPAFLSLYIADRSRRSPQSKQQIGSRLVVYRGYCRSIDMHEPRWLDEHGARVLQHDHLVVNGLRLPLVALNGWQIYDKLRWLRRE
jgi:hypothetical protein